MSKANKAHASLDSATHALAVAAKARRHKAYKFWKSLPKKSYAVVGAEFGVSRQRAAVMVRKAMGELS